MTHSLTIQPEKIELLQNNEIEQNNLIFDSEITESGLNILFNNNKYSINYSTEIWSYFPTELKKFLVDNLVVCTTMHLGMVYPNVTKLIYKSARPYLEPYLYQNFLLDIPSCAEIDGTAIPDEIRKYFRLEFEYLDNSIKQPQHNPIKKPEKALISMSFGKDSLLTYALADEIGLDPEMVYIIEDSFTYEQNHKRELGLKFEREFGKKLYILNHETGKLRNYNYLGIPKSEYGWGLQNTEYALELLPFAYAFNRKYILFGNEQSTAETYLDEKYQWVVNTCYDQSPTWSVQLNQLIKTITGNSVQTGSLIEPLMDLLIQRMLVNRYPQYAKYQMSCFSDTEFGKNYKWCQNCNVCATIYLLCKAVNVDPKTVGFTKDLFSFEYKNLYTVFENEKNYCNSGLINEEQQFAFYLALKNGCNSDLTNYFREIGLYDQTKGREEELRKKFFGLHDPLSIPNELKSPLYSIFKEEINKIEF